ncbi:type II toxin-antitoxin system death-on-curing family toxin [Candidatus Woesearchaeota archaeon]|nr:type II toxin-antitoxin system death-on-curing family toxin [Candidatus Woesearchaeota archaeon]
MVSDIHYPTREKIIEYNLLILTIIKVKKADQSKVLSNHKIDLIIKECKQTRGDIYDKAISLLKGLIQKHPFASGNRRTAFIVAKEFLLVNKAAFRVQDDPSYARALQGIREGYYTDEEIKEWIKNGKIRKFTR